MKIIKSTGFQMKNKCSPDSDGLPMAKQVASVGSTEVMFILISDQDMVSGSECCSSRSQCLCPSTVPLRLGWQFAEQLTGLGPVC